MGRVSLCYSTVEAQTQGGRAASRTIMNDHVASRGHDHLAAPRNDFSCYGELLEAAGTARLVATEIARREPVFGVGSSANFQSELVRDLDAGVFELLQQCLLRWHTDTAAGVLSGGPNHALALLAEYSCRFLPGRTLHPLAAYREWLRKVAEENAPMIFASAVEAAVEGAAAVETSNAGQLPRSLLISESGSETGAKARNYAVLAAANSLFRVVEGVRQDEAVEVVTALGKLAGGGKDKEVVGSGKARWRLKGSKDVFSHSVIEVVTALGKLAAGGKDKQVVGSGKARCRRKG